MAQRNNENKLVSIVTPVLNQAAFIQQTLDSVLSQEYSQLEYIVIDGGSTDGTVEIVKSYGDRISLVSEPDNGQADAINKGFRLAQGEIVAWLNADDIYLPGAVVTVVDAFAVNAGTVCVYGDCNYVNPRGEVLSKYPAREFDLEKLVVESENFIPQPATFFLKKCLDEAGFLDESLDYVLDYELWLRFSKVGNFTYIPEEFARTRLHAGAKSVASFEKFGEELVDVINQQFKMLELPSEIQVRRDDAINNAALRAAHAAFWAGEFETAFRHTDSVPMKNISLRKKITRCYIRWSTKLDHWGFPISKWVRTARKNPYTLFNDLVES